MLSLPVAILGALLGIWYMGLTISIYTQLGMLLLVGLASKNAILIIEFAKEERELRGKSILESAAEAARERFRSVLVSVFGIMQLTLYFGSEPLTLFGSQMFAKLILHGIFTLVAILLPP